MLLRSPGGAREIQSVARGQPLIPAEAGIHTAGAVDRCSHSAFQSSTYLRRMDSRLRGNDSKEGVLE